MTDNSNAHGWFLTVTERGTIITKTPALPDGDAQYKQLHDLVGGYLEVCEQFPSPKRSGVVIQFYCDEDGLRKELPFNLGIKGNAIVGPIVIVAAKAPEIIGLTDDEAVALSDFIRRIQRAHDQMST